MGSALSGMMEVGGAGGSCPPYAPTVITEPVVTLLKVSEHSSPGRCAAATVSYTHLTLPTIYSV